jgi:hypothetical protein
MKPRKPLPRSTKPISKKRLKPRRKPFPDAADKREPVAVRVLPDGREQCNMMTAAGIAEYHHRKWKMRDRQKEICCFYGFLPECPGYMKKEDTTFDHEHKRWKKDERIEVDGHWQNGTAHWRDRKSVV